jgi:alpha/beta superfamily hydrolase
MRRKTWRTIMALILTMWVVGVTGMAEAKPGAAQSSCSTFEETGQEVCFEFLRYWAEHGGLAQQGYPISERMEERSPTDGKTYMVQYFERAVFEMHPENDAANMVLLSLLGTFKYNDKYPDGAPGQQPNNSAGSRLFAETGKRVGGVFLDYWNTHGGLAQQGLPISDEFEERSELDGKTYRVQYFERAVFESHPENQKPYDVLLTQLGTLRKQHRDGISINFTTEDGVRLAGSQYGTGKTAVVLSPMCGTDSKEGWTDFATRLAEEGYSAYTYYYRGTGSSQGRSDVATLDKDVRAAVAFARNQGANRLVLAGASCGGTISGKLAAAEKPAALIVVASPENIPGRPESNSDYSGATMPKLFVSAQDDQYTDDMLSFYEKMPDPKEKQIYSGGAHGTDIFKTEHSEDLTNLLLGFIKEHAPANQ